MLNDSELVEPATETGIARPRHGGSRASWANLLNLASVGRWDQLVTAEGRGLPARASSGLRWGREARWGGRGEQESGLSTEAPSTASVWEQGEQFGTL